ncbi:MAG: efflux RND transporter periplasmic adaptor subunit [Chloroflexi bacterium]|nr:efflux RND transporter periplasmic adaptor subunit [Chloroflexota bacterium]MBP8059162.1 efflux RND transporter periplasmic adaptor subunit [Chloroflexota bacterium]
MHRPPMIVRVIVVLVVIAAAAYYFISTSNSAANGALSASGTIEAVEIKVSPELGGRVAEVLVAEGEVVEVGQVVVRLDTTLLEGQLAQAQAGLAAANAQLALLQNSPTEAELSAVTAQVNRAQTALDTLNEQLDTAETQADDVAEQITELQNQIITVQTAGLVEQLAGLNAQLALAQQLQVTTQTQVKLLEGQVATAEAGLDAAQAQLDLAEAGPKPQQIEAVEAQVAAAQATVALLSTQIRRQTLTAPVGGVILARAIEPGEVASPGATLLLIGQLDDLTLTVYVPEDQYGQIELGQTATLTADSFPGETFTGTVRRIADQAEFTPRNVQTAEGRASTVYAIELTVTDESGQLKPGMPVDVVFGE